MPSIRDVREAREARLRRLEPAHSDVPGVIVSVSGVTRPANYPDFVYVSVFNQPESTWIVYNKTTLDVAGTPVWVGQMTRPPFWMEVKGIYAGGLGIQTDNSASLLSVSVHGQNHQLIDESNPGPDPVLVGQAAIQVLKTTGDGATLTVTIQPHIYAVNGVRHYFNGGTIDLTSSVPAANKARRVLIYLDESTTSLDIVNGTVVDDLPSISVPYPTLPEDGRGSAFVKLIGGQTTITTASDVEDFRDFLRSDNQSDLPTEVDGGIVIGEAGQWIAAIPMVDENGNIMTDENGQIMYEG